MKLDSDLFDRIRVRRDRAERTPTSRRCDQPECAEAGEYRAPKGRDREGQYWHFCLDHVRAYNQNYNYFSGMSDDDVLKYQKSAVVGHRPTWSMGATRERRGAGAFAEAEAVRRAGDPFGMFSGFGPRTGTPEQPEAEQAQGRLRMAERRALEVLDLPADADAPAIKARYKALVKRFHPDANGGDRRLEERFRSIVQAYAALRSAGLVG